ncbi:MAG: hypothetical protein WAR39_02045 [Prevotella sp.]
MNNSTLGTFIIPEYLKSGTFRPMNLEATGGLLSGFFRILKRSVVYRCHADTANHRVGTEHVMLT